MYRRKFMNDDFDFQILRLTNKFYEDYPKERYPELLEKIGRSYNCLLFQSHYGYFIGVPYRSEVKHNNAFKFKNTKRSKHHSSGLDFTKIVIIQNPDYISCKSSIIDFDEYIKTKQNINKIASNVISYIDCYMDHIKKIHILEEKVFQRKYLYSTLKYFHKELGIENCE